MERQIDRHHVLWDKREWESRPQYQKLREDSSLIVPIDREVHNELHREVPFVPVLGYYGIMAVNREFYPGRTHLETIDNLLHAVEESSKNPRVTRIEKSLTEATLQAIEAQRPFIEEGAYYASEMEVGAFK